MFKFFKGLKQMRIIFATVINTVSSLVNVGSLLFLIIYVYAVIGISLFANTKMSADQDERVNFQNLTNAFLTLIQIATGENWDVLLNQNNRGNTPEHSCIVNATYEDYINAGNQP
jgi:voltage-gated sodium channel type IV alpha